VINKLVSVVLVLDVLARHQDSNFEIESVFGWRKCNSIRQVCVSDGILGRMPERLFIFVVIDAQAL